jgi:hypothetical protein
MNHKINNSRKQGPWLFTSYAYPDKCEAIHKNPLTSSGLGEEERKPQMKN